MVFIALSSSFYVYYAQREADGVEVGGEEDVVEKWRISSSDSVTLLLLFYALHFFGSPTARRRKRETAVALITLLFWLSHAYGSFLTKQTFSFAANIGWGLMMIPVYFMLKSSRKMLGSMHVDDIDAHLQSCISLCASTVPPILFLYAEVSEAKGSEQSGAKRLKVTLYFVRSRRAVFGTQTPRPTKATRQSSVD